MGIGLGGRAVRLKSLAAILCLLVLACSPTASDLAEAPLYLELTSALPVPRDRAVSGVATDSLGDVVAWHTTDDWVALFSGESEVQRSDAVSRPVAAAFTDSRTISVVESSGDLVILDHSLAVVSRRRLDVPLLEIQSAAWSNGD